MTNQSLSWMAPLSLGAALMYLFDPTAGRRRRALLRDQTAHLARRTREASSAAACDLQNRLSGLRARWRRDPADDFADDATVEARVRSKLGRVTTHPGAIHVASIDGIVTLTGAVLADEHAAVCRTALHVPGVVDVVDQLAVHEDAGSVPGLQGEGSLPRSPWLPTWSPAMRAAAIAGGAALVAYGMQNRTLRGGVAASLGAGMLSSGFRNSRAPAHDEMPDDVSRLHETDASRAASAFDVTAGQQGILGSTPPSYT